MEAEVNTETPPEKPARLNRPIRRRIKRAGKALTRWLARHQARASRVETTPFLDPEQFEGLAQLRAATPDIVRETRDVLRHREAIPGFQDISPDQYRIARGTNWRTFVLFGFGEWLEKNAARMPATRAALEKVPTLRLAWLSILAPGYHIPAHSGVTKGLLRGHLGLVIPAEREKCRIRVGDEIRHWEVGELLVLDDTYDHEVWNDTHEERVILFFDIDRPMRWTGRLSHAVFMRLVKLSAFYRDPRRNSLDYQDRFERAVTATETVMDEFAREDQTGS